MWRAAAFSAPPSPHALSPPTETSAKGTRAGCPPLTFIKRKKPCKRKKSVQSTRAPGRLSPPARWVGGSWRIRHRLLRIGLWSPGCCRATERYLSIALVLRHYLWFEGSSIISLANCPGLGVLKLRLDFFLFFFLIKMQNRTWPK